MELGDKGYALDSAKPTILITGCTGYLGSWCTKYAYESGKYKVRGSTRNKNGKNALKLKEMFPEMEFVEAELTKDEGWDEAMKGVTHLAHTASPYFNSPPKGFDFLTPAREGTKRVLEAATRAGTVKSVVLTSSCVTVISKVFEGENAMIPEDYFSPDTGANDYAQSKLHGELAGWKWAESNPNIKFNTVHPGAIFGKTILSPSGGSVSFMQMQCGKGKIPSCCVPKGKMFTSDVQDCADAHIRSLTSDYDRTRFFVAEAIWWRDYGKCLRDAGFDKRGYMTNGESQMCCMICCICCLNWTTCCCTQLNLFWKALGNDYSMDNQKAKELLGGELRDWKKSMTDYCEDCIEAGLILKKGEEATHNSTH